MPKKSARSTKRTSIPATKLNREQRGKSKVLLIGIIAVVLVLGVGGYFLSQKSGVVVLPGMKALNPKCSYNDPNLCKFINNWATPRNYTMTSVSKVEGMTMESTYTITADNKFQMTSKHNSQENSNMIVIGDTTYTLDYSDNKMVETDSCTGGYHCC